jgi:hypothetical protein
MINNDGDVLIGPLTDPRKVREKPGRRHKLSGRPRGSEFAGPADVLRISKAERLLVQTASDSRKTTLVRLAHVSSSTTPAWQPIRKTAGLAKPSRMVMDYSREGPGESRHLQHQQHHGTEIERPLAIVMTGALITSTLFTLPRLVHFLAVRP